MTERVKSIINYGFEELKLHRIQIVCDAGNTKSKALPEKIGFSLEGILKEKSKLRESFSDELVFGILRDEVR